MQNIYPFSTFSVFCCQNRRHIFYLESGIEIEVVQASMSSVKIKNARHFQGSEMVSSFNSKTFDVDCNDLNCCMTTRNR